MTAVTLTALTCAAGLLTSTPRARWRVSITSRPVRGGLLAAVALLAVLALVGLRGNAAAAASQRAASTHHWAAAESDARDGRRLGAVVGGGPGRARPGPPRRGP